MTLSIQFLTMIYMVLGGFYLGIILDTFRRFSLYWKENRFLVYFMEVFFWLTQTFILFYILYRVNSGDLRVYVFAACLLGFSMYQVMAASLYKRLLEQLIRIFMAIYGVVKRIIQIFIVAPIKWIIYVCLSVVLFTVKAIIFILLFLINFVFQPIKWVLQKLYKALPENIQKFIDKYAGIYSIIENTCKKWIKYLTFKRR